jgi:hypothetical protein
MMMPDTFNEANHVQIIALAAKCGLPVVYPHRFNDGLISYGPDLPSLFKRAASYVDRILRGEKPAELPVQAPTSYELIQSQDSQGAWPHRTAIAGRRRRRGHRLETPSAVHESASGTFETCRRVLKMSANWGRPELGRYGLT